MPQRYTCKRENNSTIFLQRQNKHLLQGINPLMKHYIFSHNRRLLVDFINNSARNVCTHLELQMTSTTTFLCSVPFTKHSKKEIWELILSTKRLSSLKMKTFARMISQLDLLQKLPQYLPQVGQCFAPTNECHQEADDFTNWTKFMAEDLSRAVVV